MIEFLFGMANYATLALYIFWWLFISSEFNIYNKTTSWVILFIPILLVPVGVMILDIIFFEINEVIGIFFIGLGLYAFFYYLWALYETKGTFPFSSPDMKDLRIAAKSPKGPQNKVGFMRDLFGFIKRGLANFLGFRPNSRAF